MTVSSLLLHPAVRAARIILSVGFFAFLVWLLWSGGHMGYETWAAMLCLTGWNLAAERAKMANAR